MKFRLQDLFSRKILLQIYFVFFIFLNVIDFLNIIEGDLDFFKKILSWLIIGYIFYKVSLSKLFIGQKLKNYDLGLILAFCFFVIPKALVLYVSNVKEGEVIPLNYTVFRPFLDFVNSVDVHIFLTLTFLFGLVFSLVLSISILLNHDIRKNSFLGSFNFKEGYFKYFFEQFLLSFFLIFFGVIIFNFFMEWFALAVDSIILVIGLIYYLFLYIHRHGKGKMSAILSDISNAGNSFYQSLIEMFSDKKTIFIGISFLLTLHLLVDIGVYLVPYTIGTENTLYFDSLNYYNPQTGEARFHKPLVSILDYKESQISSDISISRGIDNFLIPGVVLVYLISLFGFFALMFLPFYVFYYNTQRKKVRFKSWFAILVIASLIFIFCFKIFSYFEVFSANLSLPVDFDKPLVESVRGVDIHTSTIFSSEDADANVFVQFLVSIIFFFVGIAFLLFRYEKYKFYFDKLIMICVLLFFMYYIFIFFSSSVEAEASSLKSQFGKGDYKVNYFNKALSLYEDSENFVFPATMIFENDAKTFRAEVFAFSNLKRMSQRTAEYKEVHMDYLLFDIKHINLNKKVEFSNFSRVYFENGVYDMASNKFLSPDSSFIYSLGENYFALKEVSDNEYLVDLNIEEDTLDKLIFFPGTLQTTIENVFRFIEYLRLLFVSIFYVFGGIGFFVFYFRENVWR